jgi:UDP-N-acetylglucosamine acyltransferase
MRDETRTVIHPTASVAKEATIGSNVSIGPYCVVGPDVVIGDGARLVAHVVVSGHTSIGARTVIYPFASLGTPPQSVKYRGGPTRLTIGADCDIRENVTANIGTEDDRGVTTIGDRCFLMVGSHVGHDCCVGDDVIMANNCVLGGHVNVGDHVVFGGNSAVHQFVHIGEGAMIAGVTGIGADVIPFGFAIGQRGQLDGLNVIGMRRRGFSRDEIHRMRKMYRALFLGSGKFNDRFGSVAEQFGRDPWVAKVLDFIRERRSRPLMHAMRKGAALKEPEADHSS